MHKHEKKNKNLLEGALFPKRIQGTPQKSIYMSDGSLHELASLKESKEAAQAYNDLTAMTEMERSRQSDNNLQKSVDNYNNTLNVLDQDFGMIEIPDNMVIVKLARLPHIDPKTSFVIPRIVHEPAKSGADVKGVPIENMYPYYDFGYVVKSSSSWVKGGRYVQLTDDAIMQQFQREEGKWRYYMPYEFIFWNKHNISRNRSMSTLNCYVLIRDYQVEALFASNYKPTYE